MAISQTHVVPTNQRNQFSLAQSVLLIKDKLIIYTRSSWLLIYIVNSVQYHCYFSLPNWNSNHSWWSSHRWSLV